MQYVAPRWWPLALGAYLVGGAAAAWAPAAAIRLGYRPGLGVMVGVNVVMPLMAVLVAVIYPRLRTAIPGGLLLVLGWVGMRMLLRDPQFWYWNAALLKQTTHPILVAATVAYAVIGCLTAAGVRWYRVVSPLPDQHLRCKACGYLLPGSPGPKCPECGAAFDPGALGSRA